MSTKATLSRNALMTFFCVATILAVGVALLGCHSPRGGAMPASFGTHTYESRETSPKTVRLIDIRTDEEIFVMDIPVGKQLTLDFRAGMGDDPVYTPDLMRYQLFDIGTRFGRLRSSMTVPSAQVRRLELEIRPGIEYVEPPPEEMLRVDELRDRPDWWTPRGGRMPDEHPAEIYDK